MPIKILQTSDIHLGAKLAYLGEKADLQRKTILKTFINVTDLALAKEVDIFLLAGDLFDSIYPSRMLVAESLEQISRLIEAGIYVAMIPGNHDRLELGSVYSKPEFSNYHADNFKLFREDQVEKWYLAKLDTTIHGVAVKSQKEKRTQLHGFQRNPDSKYNIGLIHGSLDLLGQPDNFPIVRAEIEQLEFNYLAIGDWHSLLDSKCQKTPAWYSGSPEILAINQENAGHVLLITMDETTKVEPVFVAQRKIRRLELDLNKYHSVQEIKNDLAAYRNPDTFFNLELKGLKAVNFDGSLEELAMLLDNYFFYLNISDKTELKLSEEELAIYPDDLLTGRYIRLLQEKKLKGEIDPHLADEAIQLGVNLLEGENVYL
ncbi:MAG: DNA repair exonuclease [bacterium]